MKYSNEVTSTQNQLEVFTSNILHWNFKYNFKIYAYNICNEL